MKKDIKLFNVLFPLWFIICFYPLAWLVAIPGNFIIDSIVLLIAVNVLKIENRGNFYKSTILKVFICGFTADFIGAGIMVCALIIGVGNIGDELYLTIPGLLISAVMICFFDYMIAFKSCNKYNRKLFSLIFAIATAPYTFLIPSSWLYG